MDTTLLLCPQRSHFEAIYTDGRVKRGTYREGSICYGAVYEDSTDYDEEEDSYKPICGLDSLTIYFNPNWLLDRELTEFVLSKEMFGTAFLDTDIDKGLVEGFKLDVSKPYHFLLGAMITLRITFNEDFVYRWKNFLPLVDNKLQALFMADRTNTEDYHYIAHKTSEWDRDVFPRSFGLSVLDFPKAQVSYPSSEGLDLEDWAFWEVWGERIDREKHWQEGRRPPSLAHFEKLVEWEKQF